MCVLFDRGFGRGNRPLGCNVVESSLRKIHNSRFLAVCCFWFVVAVISVVSHFRLKERRRGSYFSLLVGGLVGWLIDWLIIDYSIG